VHPQLGERLYKLQVEADYLRWRWDEAQCHADNYLALAHLDDVWEDEALSATYEAERCESEYWKVERERVEVESESYSRQYELWCFARRGRGHCALAPRRIPRRSPRARGAGRPAHRRTSRCSSRGDPDDEPEPPSRWQCPNQLSKAGSPPSRRRGGRQ
jgi:hypothetical protein